MITLLSAPINLKNNISVQSLLSKGERDLDKIIKNWTQNSLVVKNEGKKAEIILYGIIGDSWFDDSVSAKRFSEMLAEMGDDVEEITLRINSPGGDVFDGVTIYNRLRQSKAKVKVYVDGMAASIASVIAMAGDEVVMGKGSMMMIHKPWTLAVGNADDMRKTSDLLDQIEEQAVGIYQERVDLSEDDIKKMLREETWIKDEEAVEMGFADKVLSGDKEDAQNSLSRKILNQVINQKSEDEMTQQTTPEPVNNQVNDQELRNSIRSEVRNELTESITESVRNEYLEVIDLCVIGNLSMKDVSGYIKDGKKPADVRAALMKKREEEIASEAEQGNSVHNQEIGKSGASLSQMMKKKYSKEEK